MLPKTAEYALRAVVWLARNPQRAESADQIAASVRVPRRYLHKVLQDLIKAGLLRSQPGPGGGYQLDRKPGDISILDVVNAVGSIERIRACPLGLQTHTSLCPLHQELDKAYAEMQAAFGRVTIEQILNQPGPILPLREVSAK
jgi:Rrf2 family nitric oxide-sensitive transcriptional repressor